MKTDCSLIISTYNWPEALELTLLSVLNQTILPEEVIIADDGSTSATKDLIMRMQNLFTVPLIHIWHEDKGFRLAAIRNKAFAKASTPYIVQIDGDIILHAKFIEDHLHIAQPGFLLQGSRVMLGKMYSKSLFEKKSTYINIWSPDIKRRENGFRIPLLSRYLLKKYKNKYPIYYARGANMSFWKQDLIEVNGYNENFEGWGHEDSDLTLRLMNKGVKKMIIKFAAIAYHLFHPEKKEKSHEERNKSILAASVKEKTIWNNFGLEKYLENGKS
ncbi:glycosyltransferase family 2 protein [Sphingobacterium chuzhouense]|uniref:Glycosyltransferase family 2 protein n=1 Tax=Sphingobacterium chuzhouense TaxID=1742264 RepID=A0ABR7XM38_9SPHI|nr:glycosyltransferase family 2 protein [Sphingobacterium chuzhouense]MBD1420238.1 glycosyltransferase family 2 protein [Sphingobacterium chuzhouense]